MSEQEKAPNQERLNAVPDTGAETALAIFNGEEGGFGFNGPLALWTSIDKTTDEGKALILRASTGQADLKAEDIMADPFPMQHLLAQKVQILEERTGELVTMDRVVLISPDGKTVSFVSAGIMNCLKYIMGLYGRPPYQVPLWVRTRLVTTRKGFKTWNLDIVPAPKQV